MKITKLNLFFWLWFQHNCSALERELLIQRQVGGPHELSAGDMFNFVTVCFIRSAFPERLNGHQGRRI